MTITIWFQDLFIFDEEYFSAFSHLTFFSIGLPRYLELEVDASRLPAPYPRNSTLEVWNQLSGLLLLDYHNLWYAFPGNFGSTS